MKVDKPKLVTYTVGIGLFPWEVITITHMY